MRALVWEVSVLRATCRAGVAFGVNADVFSGPWPAGRWLLVRRWQGRRPARADRDVLAFRAPGRPVGWFLPLMADDDYDVVSRGGSLAHRSAYVLMCPGEPTDVPPYLCTINAMFHCAFLWVCRQLGLLEVAIITIFT